MAEVAGNATTMDRSVVRKKKIFLVQSLDIHNASLWPRAI
jgi:hypothetical protein